MNKIKTRTPKKHLRDTFSNTDDVRNRLFKTLDRLLGAGRNKPEKETKNPIKVTRQPLTPRFYVVCTDNGLRSELLQHARPLFGQFDDPLSTLVRDQIERTGVGLAKIYDRMPVNIQALFPSVSSLIQATRPLPPASSCTDKTMRAALIAARAPLIPVIMQAYAALPDKADAYLRSDYQEQERPADRQARPRSFHYARS